MSVIQPTVNDINVAFHETNDTHAPLLIHKQQDISQDFLDDLKVRRDASMGRASGDFALAASIPTIVHEQWLTEGYDCTREPLSKTFARLKATGLDAFIATNKRV